MKTKGIAIVAALALLAAGCLGGCGGKLATSSAGVADTPSATETAEQPPQGDAAPAAELAWKPERPITMVVGFNPGGGIDAMARTLAPAMEEYLGVSVVVENMPGSSSGVAAEYVQNQAADGYTIFACSSSVCVFATTENSDVTYHDMEILAMPFSTHNPAVLVGADSGIDTMEQFIEMLQTGNTTASHAGVGSTWHIPGAMIASNADALDNITFVPYDSGKETTLAVARGECEWTACGIYQESSEAIRSGMVKPLAIVNAQPFVLEGFGEVPSILDAMPELEAYIDILGGWRGVGCLPETPDNIKQALAGALEYAIQSEGFQRLLTDNGVAESPILYGADAQAMYEKSSRVYSWLLYDLGDSPRNPDDLNVPRFA